MDNVTWGPTRVISTGHRQTLIRHEKLCQFSRRNNPCDELMREYLVFSIKSITINNIYLENSNSLRIHLNHKVILWTLQAFAPPITSLTLDLFHWWRFRRNEDTKGNAKINSRMGLSGYRSALGNLIWWLHKNYCTRNNTCPVGSQGQLEGKTNHN